MTKEDKELRQGRSREQHDQNFKVLEVIGSLGLIAFAVYILLRPWL